MRQPEPCRYRASAGPTGRAVLQTLWPVRGGQGRLSYLCKIPNIKTLLENQLDQCFKLSQVGLALALRRVGKVLIWQTRHSTSAGPMGKEAGAEPSSPGVTTDSLYLSLGANPIVPFSNRSHSMKRFLRKERGLY